MKTFILDSTREMLGIVFGYIPTLLIVLAIIGIGLVIARMLGKTVGKLLKEIHLDKISGDLGVDAALKRGGIKRTTSDLLGSLTYWVVAIMVLVMGARALGLTTVDTMIATLFAYVPNVIAAVFVLLFGMIIASFVASLVTLVAGNLDLPNTRLLSSLTKWAIVLFAVKIFIAELGFGALITGGNATILFGAICVALAISFGLGGRDTAEKYLTDARK